MRDVATVTPGEHVTVEYKGSDRLKGVYVGYEDGEVVIDYTFGTASIPLDSGRVSDMDSLILGVPQPK
jgi:hypothetical protein